MKDENKIEIDILEYIGDQATNIDGILTYRINDKKNIIGFSYDEFSNVSNRTARIKLKKMLKDTGFTYKETDIGLWNTIGKKRQPDIVFEIK